MSKNQYDTESYKKYISEIKSNISLTLDEERELLKKIRNGDKLAKKEFFERHLKFVVSIAKEYVNDFLELNDLISEGNLGLLIAMDKYDFDVSTRFMSYAVWWIRQNIIHSINKNSRTIRLPENVIIDIKNNNCTKEIPRCVPLILDDDQLEKNFNVSDYYIIDNPNEYNSLLTDSMLGLLKNLKKRDKHIIEMCFGLNGFEPMNLEEISVEVNLSKERVRQIKNNSIKKLKHLSRDLIRIKNA